MFDDPRCYALMVEDYNKECQWAMERYKDKMSWETGEYILDIGSGTGQTTCEVLKNALRPDFKKLVGIDICPKMVNYAHSNWIDDHRINFIEMDISTTKDPWANLDKEIQESGGFHKITSFFCLHWVKDRKRMFDNIFQLLRPGGCALVLFMVKIITYNVWDQIAVSDKWVHFFPQIKLPFNDYIYMSDPGEVFSNEAENAGFTVEVEVVERKETLLAYSSSDEERKTRVRSVDPMLRLLPEHLREEYLEDYLERMLKLDSRGPIDYTALLALLKKQ